MSSQDVEAVLDRLGGYGRYQVLLYVALGLVNMRGCWHVFVSIFVGWPPSHHCRPWPNHPLNQSLPWEENNYGEEGSLVHSKSNLCLDVDANGPVMINCDPNRASQIWGFTRYDTRS